MSDEHARVTALVVMKPASRRVTVDARSTTAGEVASLAPSAAAVEKVSDHLRSLGCEVGPLVGISFAISMPPDVASRLLDGPADLPRPVKRSIDRIVRDEPIDFGPVSFG